MRSAVQLVIPNSGHGELTTCEDEDGWDLTEANISNAQKKM